jgi:hypothetical protein
MKCIYIDEKTCVLAPTALTHLFPFLQFLLSKNCKIIKSVESAAKPRKLRRKEGGYGGKLTLSMDTKSECVV